MPEDAVEVKVGGACHRLNTFIIHPYSWFYWIFSVFMCFFGVLSGWLIMYQVLVSLYQLVVCWAHNPKIIHSYGITSLGKDAYLNCASPYPGVMGTGLNVGS